MIQRAVKLSVISTRTYNINAFPVVSITIYKGKIYSVFTSVLDADYWCFMTFFGDFSHCSAACLSLYSGAPD